MVDSREEGEPSEIGSSQVHGRYFVDQLIVSPECAGVGCHGGGVIIVNHSVNYGARWETGDGGAG